MSILPDAIRVQLPALYSQEEAGEGAIVHARLILPALGWNWLVTEFDGDDLMFCLVIGAETELGYVSLGELEALRAPVRLDATWEPMTLAAARAYLAGDSIPC